MRVTVGCLLLAIPLGVLFGAPARACTCASRYAWAFWPRPGALDVALDAPLVVTSFDLGLVATKLTADDGTEIELIEKARLDQGPHECANPRYLFLAPARPLEPHREYVLTTWLSDASDDDLLGDPVHFFTGNQLRDPTPQPDLALHLYGSPELEGQRLELFIQSQSSEPVFVGFQGEHASRVKIVLPASLSQDYPDPLPIPFGVVECANLALVDVAGRTFSTPRLCQPSKCTTTKGLYDTCGGEVSSGLAWEGWQRVPDGCGSQRPDGTVTPESTTDLVTAESGSPHTADSVTADSASLPTEVTRADAPDPPSQSRGCAFTSPRSPNALLAPLLAAALALLLCRRAQRAHTGVEG